MDEQHHLAQYRGELRNGRMHGKGTYWFDSGSKYVGEFKDGTFHGEGTLHFKHGGRYEATWLDGIEQSGEYLFTDECDYDPIDWTYCTEEDRRFYPEHVNGLRPSNRCLMSTESDLVTGRPIRFIPNGCYDTGEGTYDPRQRVVFNYGSGEETPFGEFKHNATDEEHEWIVKSCRKGLDKNVGIAAKK